MMTDDMARYARTCCEVAVRRMRIPDATAEDAEDMVSYCLRRIVARWPAYDPSRSAWKTYVSVLAKTAARDARRWLMRQRRIATVELTQAIADTAPAPASDVAGVIDAIPDGIDRAVCRALWRGDSPKAIRDAMGMRMRDYRASLARIRAFLAGGIPWPPPP